MERDPTHHLTGFVDDLVGQPDALVVSGERVFDAGHLAVDGDELLRPDRVPGRGEVTIGADQRPSP